MSPISFRLFVPVALLLGSFSATAQSPQVPSDATVNPPVVIRIPIPDPTVIQPTQGNTSLTLGMDVTNGIATAALPGRVRIPEMEHLRLLAPEGWSYPIQWTLNGRAIPGATGRVYDIPFTIAEDTGLYSITGAPAPVIAVGVALTVARDGGGSEFQRVSSRTDLGTGRSGHILTFTVHGPTSKRLLIRAVGPSLRTFGITNPVTDPAIRVSTANGFGVPVTLGSRVINPMAFFNDAGAFQLSAREQSFVFGIFPPGDYSIIAGDESGKGGTILVETYEYFRDPPLSN